MKKHFLLLAMFVTLSLYGKAQTEVDITNLTGGKASSQFNDSPDGENATKLIDNDSSTKHLTFHSSAWVQFQSPSPYIITKYTITSGNDSEERDPLNWELSGSNNGVTFYLIDKKENQDFADREAKREFSISNNKTSYTYYRLTMTNNAGNILQLSELELFGVAGVPFKDVLADFSIHSYLVTGDSISFENASLNANSYKWTFKGGNPSTSKEMNPKVVYNKPGVYKAKLVVKNKSGNASKQITITVKDKNDWSSFIYPKINIECVDTTNLGYQKYLSMVKHKGFNNIQEFVDNCCLTIAKKLYYTVDEANETNLRSIKYKLTAGGYISYKDGENPDILIGFDMDYLMNFSKTHVDSVCADEVYGILCHELCHGYQNWPKNCGEYGKSSENFGFVEGTCDLARLLTGGFNPRRYPRLGGSWMDGYNTTGFFYYWINNNIDANFLKDLNKSAKTINPWSLDAVTKQLYGLSAQELWNKYQLAVPSLGEKK